MTFQAIYDIISARENVENGVSYVWLLEDKKDDNNGGTVIVLPEKHEHDYRYLETVAPSCDNLGYERWQCDGCGNLDKRNYTKATGHNYKAITNRVEGSIPHFV